MFSTAHLAKATTQLPRTLLFSSVPARVWLTCKPLYMRSTPGWLGGQRRPVPTCCVSNDRGASARSSNCAKIVPLHSRNRSTSRRPNEPVDRSLLVICGTFVDASVRSHERDRPIPVASFGQLS